MSRRASLGSLCLVSSRPRAWWATLVPGQHQWPLRVVRREEWIAAAMARSA
jgi:hypothetical protein